MLTGLFTDLRLAVRSLGKAPTFTLTAVATLALALGANTTVLTILDAVLLRSLPYSEEETLVTFWGENAVEGIHQGGVSPADFRDWEAQSQSIEAFGLYGPHGFLITGIGHPEDIPALIVSPGFFDVLGIRAALGRTFGPAETEPGKLNGVVMSDHLWRRKFDADPEVVGRSIQLSGVPYTILGVMPPNFEFPNRQIGFWAPFPFDPSYGGRNGRWMGAVGRLAEKSDLRQARTEFEVISRRLSDQYPASNENWEVQVLPIREAVTGKIKAPLLMLQIAAGIILLISCVNLVNLLLARHERRRSRQAVRIALGCPRGRLTRMLMTENCLLAVLGGLAGLGLSRVGLMMAGNLLPLATQDTVEFEAFRMGMLGLDGRIWLLTVLTSLLTVLCFGLLPSFWAARVDPYPALRIGPRNPTPMGRWLRRGLVITELALAVTLLIGAGAVLLNYYQIINHDPGFRQDNLLVFRIGLSAPQYRDPLRRKSLFQSLQSEVRALPGVASVGASTSLPFSGVDWTTEIVPLDRAPVAGRANPRAHHHSVTLNYFRTLGIHLRKGRAFREEDLDSPLSLAVISEGTAQVLWPRESAIGNRFRMQGIGPPREFEVLGIVADSQQLSLDAPVQNQIYVLNAKQPSFFLDFAVRAEINPLALAEPIRKRVHSLDPDLPIENLVTMESRIARSISQVRLNTFFLAGFGLVAILVATVGVYGVMSYLVALRSPEMAIRHALGAARPSLIWDVAAGEMKGVLVGVALGLISGMMISRFLEEQLGVEAGTPALYFVVAVGAALISLIACLPPAVKAAKTDPVAVLRING